MNQPRWRQRRKASAASNTYGANTPPPAMVASAALGAAGRSEAGPAAAPVTIMLTEDDAEAGLAITCSTVRALLAVTGRWVTPSSQLSAGSNVRPEQRSVLTLKLSASTAAECLSASGRKRIAVMPTGSAPSLSRLNVLVLALPTLVLPISSAVTVGCCVVRFAGLLSLLLACCAVGC